jgi:hypothetical protein
MRAGMKTLVKGISALLHRKQGLVFAQNGDDIISGFVRYLDGGNREDVSYT